jgi:hypothetical protein
MKNYNCSKSSKKEGNMADGRQLRDKSIALLKAARREWIDGLHNHLKSLCIERMESDANAYVSGDDAVEWLDERGCPHDYRLVGAVFHKSTNWKEVGRKYSVLSRRHNREIRCWRWAVENELA